MSWSIKRYEESLKDVDINEILKENSEPLRVKEMYEYAKNKNVSVSELTMEERESFITKY